MSHELHFTNGAADFFEVGLRRSAWHREGTLLHEAPSLAAALECAHLDYPVIKVPTFYPVQAVTPNGDTYEKLVRSERAYITQQALTGAELGAVGPDYQPLQNRDVFRSMEPLLDAGILRLETGGVLRDGADAWLLSRFDLDRMGPICREVFGDELRAFGLWRTNHSGRRPASVGLTDIRVVCANTVAIADAHIESGRDPWVRVRHTGAVEARMVEAARQLFAGIVERYEGIAATYRRLKAAALDEALFRRLVLDAAVTDPRTASGFDPNARGTPKAIERYEHRTAEIRRLWTDGAGHAGDGSAWEALNAVVESIDHNAELWPTRGSTPRIQALLDGHLGAAKRAVFDSLVHFAEEVA